MIFLIYRNSSSYQCFQLIHAVISKYKYLNERVICTWSKNKKDTTINIFSLKIQIKINVFKKYTCLLLYSYMYPLVCASEGKILYKIHVQTLHYLHYTCTIYLHILLNWNIIFYLSKGMSFYIHIWSLHSCHTEKNYIIDITLELTKWYKSVLQCILIIGLR